MDDATTSMLDEIAAALRSGEYEVLDWLREQLEQTGASEVAVELSLGVIARLMERSARDVDRGPPGSGRSLLH